LASANKKPNANPPVKKPRYGWWTRFVSFIKRKLDERAARKQAKKQESPTDKAARTTAGATVWMAVFTALLAATSGLTIWVLINQLGEMRMDRRAWVGVQSTESIDFSEAVPWKVTVIFFNSGRSPARNVQSSLMYQTSPVPLSGPSAETIARLHFRPAQSIAPQATYHQHLGSYTPSEASTPDQVQGANESISEYPYIKNRKLFLYYFGILKYDDIFGNHRETQFCIYLANPDTKEVGFCDSFNDLN